MSQTYVLRSQYLGASCNGIDVVLQVALVKRVHFFNERLARLCSCFHSLGRKCGRKNFWEVFLYPTIKYEVPVLVYPYYTGSGLVHLFVESASFHPVDKHKDA